jgi:hypothetical protein
MGIIRQKILGWKAEVEQDRLKVVWVQSDKAFGDINRFAQICISDQHAQYCHPSTDCINVA